MTYDNIQKVDNNITLSTTDEIELASGLSIPKSMLLDYGCRNCFFKATERCPLGFTGSESNDKGYCDYVVGFLSSLADDKDTINDIKEKYQIEVQSQQALSDFSEFKEMERELKKRRNNNEFGPAVDALEMRVMAYKTWWTRLSEQASKGWSKINDRKSRSKDTDININHKIDLGQLHSIMNKARQVQNTIEVKALDTNND